MKKNKYEVTECRLCKSSLPRESVVSLPPQYVSTFLSPNESPGEKVPIEVCVCDTCKLVQLRHTAPQELLYRRHYWYRSGLNKTIRNDLANSAKELGVYLSPGDIVLDIGSNDGTMLRHYDRTVTTVGVEPAQNLSDVGSNKVDVFINDFWSKEAYFDNLTSKASVITAFGMFYDLQDPVKFVSDVAACLKRDGIFVAQLMCLKNMLDNNDVGNLTHEHLEFYSLQSLKYLYDKCGLEIFRIETAPINGESYKIWARHKGRTKYSIAVSVEYYFYTEQNLEDDLVRFSQEIETNKQLVVDFIKEEVAKGKTCWTYGASTKGSTILQYYELDDSLITGAYDINPDKIGKRTVGSNIPIYGKDKFATENPDYLLVLPYGFINEFIHKERSWLSRGGIFIVPLPKFNLVDFGGSIRRVKVK